MKPDREKKTVELPVDVLAVIDGAGIVVRSSISDDGLPNVIFRSIEGCEATSWLSLVHRRFEKSPAVLRYIEQARRAFRAAEPGIQKLT